MVSFIRLDADEMPWDRLEEFEGANIFQTREWIEFLADYFGAEPVTAAVQMDGQVQGYFTGLITRKFGVSILGSPFRGWNTYFMGFNLKPGGSYHDVLQALPSFAFKELKCHFLMLIDANLKKGDCEGLLYHIRKIENFAFDLTKSDEELLASMKGKSCRRHIHRAIKKGVGIEEVSDPGFAEEYYCQYLEVMQRHGLAPDYTAGFVREMIRRLLPTGCLLLLRANDPEGRCIATNIDLVFNKVAVGWGGASCGRHKGLYPNELICLTELQKLKARGVKIVQIADTNKQFKEKCGAYEIHAFRLMKARSPWLYFPIYTAIAIHQRGSRLIRKMTSSPRLTLKKARVRQIYRAPTEEELEAKDGS